MIITRLYGGLGNQLFQYAAGYALSTKLNTTLGLDISHIAYNKNRPYVLHNYTISSQCHPQGIPSALRRRISTGLGRRNILLQRIYDAYFMKIRYTLYHADETPIHSVDEKFFEIEDNTYIIGYFQMPRYFSHVTDKLREEFKLRRPLSARAEKYKHVIAQSKNAVSIHMRCGDFSAKDRLQKCYYSDAISYINARIRNPQYFVFSDEVEETQKMFRNNIIKRFIHYIEPANNEHAYEDLHLMSLCSHNIIANSSFSWWAAFLGSCENKIVIAPSLWRKSISFSQDAFPKNWVRITTKL